MVAATAPLYEEGTRTLIDTLLAEQQQLTAVERFARQHEAHALPAQAQYYRALLPATKPGPGEQYAFSVNLDTCTGCKACVSACHSLNGLDEEEIWRNVGALHGGTPEAPYQQTVTTACHHCVEPGCLQGCPVAAYEKDPVTGIVRHLDDQCIGCEYCMLKCPYDVPKYSHRRGIVRKCDMCSQRLAADEAPACVQACPNGAITIQLVKVAQVRAEALPGARLLPGAFESSYTRPTTTYVTQRAIPANAHPADVYRLRLEHPHWPLIGMLLLAQTSAGMSCLLAGAAGLPADLYRASAPGMAWAAFAFLQAGLCLSVFHLGQPQKAWRFFLGLRTSWMSREILAFSLLAGLCALTAGASLSLAPGAPAVWEWLQAHVPLVPPAGLALVQGAVPLLAMGTAGLALAAMACSAMIYVDTHRPFWSGAHTFPKFGGTSLMLGATATAALLGWLPVPALAAPACWLALGVQVTYQLWEAAFFVGSLRRHTALAHRSARTMWALLQPVLELRGGMALATWGLTGLAALAGGTMQAGLMTLAWACAMAGSVAERYCFFTASDAPRMPGGIAA